MIYMLREIKTVKVQQNSDCLYVAIPRTIAEKLNLQKGDSLIPLVQNGKLIYCRIEDLKEVL